MIRCIILPLLFVGLALTQESGREFLEYKKIQNDLQRGWNTWNTRSVLQQVLLPQGFAINIAFKQHYYLEEQYLREALIGRKGKDILNTRTYKVVHVRDALNDLHS